MPKLVLRSDGSCYVKAAVVPGSSDIRSWEVNPRGVSWLRKRGILVGQEMGRRNFQELLNHRYAYIANPSAKQPVQRSKSPRSNGTSVTVWTVPGDMYDKQQVEKNRPAVKPGRTTRATPQLLAATQTKTETKSEKKVALDVTVTATSTSSAPSPSHWRRRTKKKDWFD